MEGSKEEIFTLKLKGSEIESFKLVLSSINDKQIGFKKPVSDESLKIIKDISDLLNR